MSLKQLVAVWGGLEASGGAVSLIAPGLVIEVLFGVSVDTVSVVLARFFGAGILSFGLAAVLARRQADSPAGLSIAYGVILWVAGIGHALPGLLFLRAVSWVSDKGALIVGTATDRRRGAMKRLSAVQ